MGNPLPRRAAENPTQYNIEQSPNWSMTPLNAGRPPSGSAM